MVKCIRTTRAQRQAALHPNDLANIEAYVATMRRRSMAAGTINKAAPLTRAHRQRNATGRVDARVLRGLPQRPRPELAKPVLVAVARLGVLPVGTAARGVRPEPDSEIAAAEGTTVAAVRRRADANAQVRVRMFPRRVVTIWPWSSGGAVCVMRTLSASSAASIANASLILGQRCLEPHSY